MKSHDPCPIFSDNSLGKTDMQTFTIKCCKYSVEVCLQSLGDTNKGAVKLGPGQLLPLFTGVSIAHQREELWESWGRRAKGMVLGQRAMPLG